MNPTPDPNSFEARLNLVPECLRPEENGGPPVVSSLDSCVYESLLYYIDLLLVFVAIAAFFYIIYAGIQMATALGNESKYAAAKNTLLHAVIGVVVATLAFTVVGVFTNILGVDSRFQYIDDKGETIENNEAEVTSRYQILEMANPPKDESLLTEDEYRYIRANGVRTDELTSSGTNAGLYLINSSEFKAELHRKDGGVVVADVQKRGNEYVARIWGPTSHFRESTLRIYQYDKGGVQHYKAVKIK